MVKKSIATLVAAAFSAIIGSGCYVNPPYSYVRIDTPAPESGTVMPRQREYWPERRTQPTVPVQGNCMTFAAPSGTIIDNGNGEKYVLENSKSVEVCTCYSRLDPATSEPDPRSAYSCQILVR